MSHTSTNCPTTVTPHIIPAYWLSRLSQSYLFDGSTTTLPATSEIDCTGCPFSSAWRTRSVNWFSSVFTRWHQSTLQWWATRFLPPLAKVISDLQHAAIWRYIDHERWLTDKDVFPSLVRQNARFVCRAELFCSRCQTRVFLIHSLKRRFQLLCRRRNQRQPQVTTISMWNSWRTWVPQLTPGCPNFSPESWLHIPSRRSGERPRW